MFANSRNRYLIYVACFLAFWLFLYYQTHSDSEWKKTAVKLPLPVNEDVYFFSMSELAGDWTPTIAVEDKRGQLHMTMLSVNSVPRDKPTPVYYLAPNTIFLAGQVIDLAAQGQENAAKNLGSAALSATATAALLGQIERRTDGDCCWKFVDQVQKPH